MEDSYVLNLKERKFSDIYLCFCGYSKCESLHSFGPYVRPNYILHYILEGRGKYSVGKKTYELEAGQGFLIKPEVLTFYQADKDDPWRYVWVGFDGVRVNEYLQDIGLNDDIVIFDNPYGDEIYDTVNEMLAHNTYQISNEFVLEGLLYKLFGILARDVNISATQKGDKENLYVSEGEQYIVDNYSNPIRVQDIANYVGINRSYLSTLFKRELGYSPQEYLANYRLTRGANLLSGTDYSVESIAMSCGYQDPLVFTKAFKRKFDITPLNYRKEVKERRKDNRKRVRERMKEL